VLGTLSSGLGKRRASSVVKISYSIYLIQCFVNPICQAKIAYIYYITNILCIFSLDILLGFNVFLDNFIEITYDSIFRKLKKMAGPREKLRVLEAVRLRSPE
jgi:hypothetical protein